MGFQSLDCFGVIWSFAIGLLAGAEVEVPGPCYIGAYHCLNGPGPIQLSKSRRICVLLEVLENFDWKRKELGF